MTDYVVKRGDNLTHIARRFGIKHWRDLYNHPKNTEFRRKRTNPNLIYPGDVLYVPDTIFDFEEMEIRGEYKKSQNVDISKLSDAEKRKLVDELGKGLPRQTKQEILEYLGWAGRGLKVFDLVNILEVFVNPKFLGGMGILSVLTISVQSLLAWVAAMEVNKRMYGVRAWAYTTTAWAFDERRPSSSPEMLSRYVSKSDAVIREREELWRTVSSRTWQELDMTSRTKGTSKRAYQEAIKFMGFQSQSRRGSLKEKLCYELLKSQEHRFKPGIDLASWQDGYNLLYPK